MDNKKGQAGTSSAATPPAAASPPSGAPRWTYAVGSVVAAVGLIWGIVSSFIPKPGDTARPAPGAGTAVAPPPSVTVSGTGNLGVGNNSGTITIGQPALPAAPANPASAGAR